MCCTLDLIRFTVAICSCGKKQIVAFFSAQKYQKCLSPCPNKIRSLIKPALKNNRSFLYLFLFLFLIIFLFSFPYFTFHQKLEVQKVAQSRCWTPLSTSTTCQYKFTSKYKFYLDFNCRQNPCLNVYCMIKYDRILRNGILNFNFKAFVKHLFFLAGGYTHSSGRNITMGIILYNQQCDTWVQEWRTYLQDMAYFFSAKRMEWFSAVDGMAHFRQPHHLS